MRPWNFPRESASLQTLFITFSPSARLIEFAGERTTAKKICKFMGHSVPEHSPLRVFSHITDVRKYNFFH